MKTGDIKSIKEINAFTSAFQSKYNNHASLLEGALTSKNGIKFGQMGAFFKEADQYARDAIKHLQNPNTAPKDLSALLKGLEKLKPLQEFAVKKGSWTKMKQASLGYSQRSSLIYCMKQVKKVNDTVNQVLSQVDSKGRLQHAASILADRKVDKTLKTLLLNVYAGDTSLKDQLLLSNQKIQYGKKQLALHEWLYNSAFYGESYELRGNGIKRAFQLCADSVNLPKSITQEKYTEFVDFLVAHKYVKLDANVINPTLLNKDSLQTLLQSGRVTNKDVLPKLAEYDIRTLQAQTKGRGKQAGPRIITSILNSKSSGSAQTVKGVIARSIETYKQLSDSEQSEMQGAIRLFAQDALRVGILDAKDLGDLTKNGLVQEDVFKELASMGLFTEEILNSKLNSKAGDTVLNYCMLNDIRVGVHQERFSHWAERTHPNLMTNKKPLRDVEIEMLQSKQGGKQLDKFKTLLEKAIIEGIRKDAATGRNDGTVLNELNLQQAASQAILHRTLLQTDSQNFAAISNKLKPQILKYIIDINHNIEVASGSTEIHPLLAISRVDFSNYPDDIVKSMANALQNARVTTTGGIPDTENPETSMPLLEYAQKAGYKFSTATFDPKLAPYKNEIAAKQMRLNEIAASLTTQLAKDPEVVKLQSEIQSTNGQIKHYTNMHSNLQKALQYLPQGADPRRIQVKKKQIDANTQKINALTSELAGLNHKMSQVSDKFNQKIENEKNTLQQDIQKLKEQLKALQSKSTKGDQGTKATPKPKLVTPIQAILNVGNLVNVDAISQMDIRTSDILDARNESNKTLVSCILLARVLRQNLQTETVCELIARSKSGANAEWHQSMLKEFTNKIAKTGFAADPEGAKATLEGYLKSGKLTPKDVMQNFGAFPIEALQAKAKNGKTISEIIMSSQNKAAASGLVMGAIQDAAHRIKNGMLSDEAAQLEIKPLLTDALKHDVLNAKHITAAFESKLISLQTVREWSEKGMLTEQVLAGQVLLSTNVQDLQHHVIEQDMKVGKQRIADWMDKKHFESLSGEEKIRDLDIKALVKQFAAIALSTNTSVHQHKGKVTKALQDVIKADVMKDLREKDRHGTVLNDLAVDGSLNTEVFKAALSVVTPAQFAALSRRINNDALEFIVNNAIPIGPKATHPLLVLESVNLHRNQDVGYIMESLQTHKVGKNQVTLLESMHQNKFKFRRQTDPKALESAQKDSISLKTLYERKKVFDQEFERTQHLVSDNPSILKSARADYKQLLSEIKKLEDKLARFKTSPYTSKDPLEAVLSSGHADIKALAKMDISAKDILSRLNERNAEVVGKVLAQRVKDGKDITKTMCTIMHAAMQNPKNIDLLNQIDKKCQNAMLQDGVKPEASQLNEFASALGVYAVNKNIARALASQAREQTFDSNYHAKAEFTFHMLSLEVKCNHISTMHYLAPHQKEFTVDLIRWCVDNIINGLKDLSSKIRSAAGYKVEADAGNIDSITTIDQVAKCATSKSIDSMQNEVKEAVAPNKGGGRSA